MLGKTARKVSSPHPFLCAPHASRNQDLRAVSPYASRQSTGKITNRPHFAHIHFRSQPAQRYIVQNLYVVTRTIKLSLLLHELEGSRGPPNVFLAPTALWRVPPCPTHCDWRTFPSSPSRSLPTFPLPLPPTPWLFWQCSGRVRPGLAWARGPRAQGGWIPSKRHLGPDPHLRLLEDPKAELVT